MTHNQLCNYPNYNNLILHKYSGFRQCHSTDQAVNEDINGIYDSLNQGKHTSSISIDLSKPFDTVHHNILFNKLGLCGMKNESLNLFQREQFLYVGAVRMSNLDIFCNVPRDHFQDLQLQIQLQLCLFSGKTIKICTMFLKCITKKRIALTENMQLKLSH